MGHGFPGAAAVMRSGLAQHATLALFFYFYPELQQASCTGLLMQDLLAEMLRTAEAAAGRERQGGAGAGEVCVRWGHMDAGGLHTSLQIG